MQFPKVFHLILIIIFPISILAQKEDKLLDWPAIQNLQNEGKYKSAYDAALVYFDHALKSNQYKEVFRGLTLIDDLLENAMLASEEKHALLESIAKKTATTSGVNRSIIYHHLANVFENSAWKYDLYTWNGDVELKILVESKFYNYSNFDANSSAELQKALYLASVSYADENSKAPYAAITFEKITKEDSLFIPSLQDYFTRSAINYFKYYEVEPVFSGSTYLKSFGPIATLNEKDSALVLDLYRQIENLNWDKKEWYAYTNWNLERLHYLKQLNKGENVAITEAYNRALDTLKATLNGHPATLGVDIERVKFKRSDVSYNYDWRINTAAKNNNEKDVVAIETALANYSTSFYKAEAEHLLKDYKKTNVQLILTSKNELNKPNILTVNYKNISSLVLGVYHIESVDENMTARSYKKYQLSEISTETLQLDQNGLYNTHSKDFILQKNTKPGSYLLIAAPTKEKLLDLLHKDTIQEDDTYSAIEFAISSLKLVGTIAEKGVELIVRDAQTGKPIVGATVKNRILQKNSSQVERLTDKNGYVFIANDELPEKSYYFSFIASKGSDSSASVTLYGYKRNTQVKNQEKAQLFVDRSLYRPGQKVYFKYLAYTSVDTKFNVKAGEEVTLELINPSDKSIQKITGVTNEFGSFAGSLILPSTNSLNGQYALVAKNASIYFNVEEYKLPTYDIKLSSNDETMKAGDSLLITGEVKAFSGYSISNAKVQLSIVQQTYFYRSTNTGSDFSVDTTLVTDNNGKFSFYFFPGWKDDQKYQSFLVNAFITSSAGESQEASKVVSIGKKKDALSGTIPSIVWTDKSNNIRFSLTDKPAESVHYDLRIYRLKNKTVDAVDVVKSEFSGFSTKEFEKAFPNVRLVYEKESENDYERLTTKTLLTSDSVDLIALINATAGSYKIEVQLELDEAIQTYTFLSIDPSSSKNQHVSYLWSSSQKTTLKVGDVAKVLVGSSLKKAPILVRWYRGNTIIASEFVTLKKRKYFEYQIAANDIGGITFEAILVANNSLYRTRTDVKVPNVEQQLTISLLTKRDLLTPGGKEKWSFNVKDVNEKGIISEVMALMTDYSLNQLMYPQTYELNPFSVNYCAINWTSAYINPRMFAYVNGNWAIDYGVVNFESSQTGYGRGSGSTKMDARAISGTEISNASPIGAISKKLESDSNELENTDNLASDASISKRTNFDETAFFYPQLRTNENGELLVEFTLPDGLTEWDLNLLAHTKELKVGKLQQQFKAEKKLMVQPNTPRFVREGDEIDFRATVVNNSEEVINAEVSLEWFNPFTNEVLLNYFGELPVQMKQIAANESEQVSWRIKVPKNALSLIAYRMVVKGGSNSDAEEKVIPILSNRVEVVEAIPLTLTKKGLTTVELNSLNNRSTTQQNIRLNINYATSPVWNVITAIPSVLSDISENVISLSDNYFVNELAAKIVKDNPAILAFLKSVSQVASNEFSSALENNAELKSIVLDETPWLLDATNETEQKRRILSFFDENALKNTQDVKLSKLISAQNNDGGWSWFNGGISNELITAHVLLNFARLNQMDKDVFQSGFNYLTNRYSQEFEKAKKANKLENLSLSAEKIKWLYLTAKLDAENSTVIDFYSNLLVKNWKQYPLQLQGLAGIYFLNQDNIAMAKKIFASIDDRKTVNNALGVFWNENKNSYGWDRNVIETQAQLIQFYQTMSADKSMVQGMINWLLNQKRGQFWGTNKATAQACFSILNASAETKELISGSKPTVSMQVGAEHISIQTNEVGSFDKIYTANELSSNMGTITFDKQSDDLNFAAVHFTYTEEINKIQSNVLGLKLTKSIFLVDDDKEVSVDRLKVGDKIRVKLQLVADRNLEYLYLKDLRASGTENLAVVSGYATSGNLSYYQVNHDASMGFFIDQLPKGTYHLSYDLVLTMSGIQSLGFASIESMYAPEFKANSNTFQLNVE